MDIFDKLKNKVQSFDPNTALASTVATVGSMTTEGYITIGYFCIAVLTSIFTLFQSHKKSKNEIRLKEIEIQMKEEDLESKKINNEMKRKELYNEEI